MAQFPSHISASGLEKFLFCPLAYRLFYIDKIPRPEWNVYTAFGSSIHKALEVNYKQKITSRKDLPLKEVVAAFNTQMDKELKEIAQQPSDALEVIRLQGEEMLYQYMKDIAPAIQPAMVEHKFEIDLKSIWVTILGYIDLVTEEDLIIDHKTAGATTRQKWTQCYVDWLVQLTMYSLVFRKMFNRVEKGNRVDVLKRLKGSVGFNHIVSTRTDQDILGLVNLLSRVKAIVENDLWYGNLSKCCECEFSQGCPKK